VRRRHTYAAETHSNHAMIIEPLDFNVTEALLDNGINVSAIPDLAGLVVRSSMSGCVIAVRYIPSQYTKCGGFADICKCKSLKLVFGDKISTNPPATYWSSQQSQVKPYCTFSPNAALEVSTLVLVARLSQCPFAVKSGGHAAFSGASSIEGGITVDLANFKQLKLSADKNIFSVGAGNRWLDVYNYLTPHNLAVVGGRVSFLSLVGVRMAKN
jgi:hypothetical protein